MAKRILTFLLSFMLVVSSTAFGEEIVPISDEYALAGTADTLTSESLLTAPLAEGLYLIDDLSLPTELADGTALSW